MNFRQQKLLFDLGWQVPNFHLLKLYINASFWAAQILGDSDSYCFEKAQMGT